MKKWFAYILCVWGMGSSIRFMISYFQNVTYKINTLDLFFDWGVLFITSIIVFILTVYESYKNWKVKDNERKVSRLRFSERSIRR
jgi:hypothetical protein